MKTFDLKAQRCPTAFILLRRSLKQFNETAEEGDTLVIQSIEPSIERDLPFFLNESLSDLSICHQSNAPITNESKLSWSSDFDEDDWQGCQQNLFVVVKQSKSENHTG